MNANIRMTTRIGISASRFPADASRDVIVRADGREAVSVHLGTHPDDPDAAERFHATSEGLLGPRRQCRRGTARRLTGGKTPPPNLIAPSQQPVTR
jgi:hypothetical protein